MAKVKFYCNSGANAHSYREEEFDTVDDLGLDEGEWEDMSEDDRYRMAEDWAWASGLTIGYGT